MDGERGWWQRSEIQDAAVSLFALLYLLPVARFGLDVYDEGIRLYGAVRILAGEVPYHDFMAYYGPAQFYWPAVLFKAFGIQVMAFRAGALFFDAVAAGSLFALCRQAGLTPAWGLVPVVAMLVPLHRGDLLYTCDPALALLLAGGAALAGANGGRARPFVAGGLFGLAAAFRQDFGVYGMLAGVAATTFGRAVEGERPRAAEGHPRRRPIHAALRQVAPLVMGFAATALPLYGLLALRGPGRLFEALVLDPARMMPFRRLPYTYELRQLYWSLATADTLAGTIVPATRILVFLSPPLLLAVCGVLAVPRLRAMVCRHQQGTTVLTFLLVAAAGLAVYGLGRSSSYQLFPLHLVSACATSIVVARLVEPGARRSWPLSTVALISVLAFGAGMMFTARTAQFSGYVPLPLPRATGLLVSPRALWLSDVAVRIAGEDDGSPIFVAAPRHDRVSSNAMVLYFLSGRRSGTFYHDFIPGFTTSREVQEQIVADLNSSRVRTVVVWRHPLPEEPNRSRQSSHVFVLDNFIRSGFDKVAETEHYELWTRAR